MLSIKEFKAGFFNPKAVTNAAERLQRAALSKLGAKIRRRMQTSIRYRKKASQPGQPPSGHKSGAFTRNKTSKGVTSRQAVSPLRELIFFAYDPSTKSVVAGPVRFAKGRAPRVLEQGGAATIRERVTPIRGKAKPKQADTFKRLLRDGRITRDVKYRERTIQVRPRPFVKPAGEAEVRRFPQTLQGLKR